MGLFRRSRDREVRVSVYTGTTDLEVKGEASYQEALALVAGPKTEEGHNTPATAVLVREPNNPYDPNAIAVYATARNGTAVQVGYVNGPEAQKLAPALDRLAAEGITVGLEGTVVGGWNRGGGDEGSYGIWLKYDPADFG
jgi:hypothetical protein